MLIDIRRLAALLRSDFKHCMPNRGGSGESGTFVLPIVTSDIGSPSLAFHQNMRLGGLFS
jgi:hypothetical protein